ncbi:hypothetical protein WJX81_002062 [Elliptochloris bilobata]|uniref:MYB transcription factor n=1 Tax=Elliptochloris bilobata TaxID=381761 RepID=A0AAW1S818_9CHLO
MPVGVKAFNDWSVEEDKLLETAFAEFWNAENRLDRVALKLPRRTKEAVRLRLQLLEEDVQNIEAGCVPLPKYLATPEPLCVTTTATKTKGDQERRKGIPWTEDEHRLFLLGLQKYGKGDWRSISRNFVISRTPTQVASHAQKYFIRLNSLNKKDKRRSSIHDITHPGGPSNGDVTGVMPAPVLGQPGMLPMANGVPVMGNPAVVGGMMSPQR